MCIPSIVVNNIYHLLVRYDEIQDTIVRFVGRPLTSISVCNVGTLHNAEMIYGTNNMTANLHTDEYIGNRTYQDGEHHMSMHNTGFDLAIDNTTTIHNILSLENNDMYGRCKMKNHVNNTQECDADRFMLECSKHIGIGKGMYKCLIVNTEYDSLAIKKTSLWIVLLTRYMHTTLNQLESNEHKIVCNRLDGRGVTNVVHLHIFEVRIQSQ